jgi:starch synthase
MGVLFGHPGGNPNSHNAALAYLEAGVLEALCIPWMPSLRVVSALRALRPFRPIAERLSRRQFTPLHKVKKIQGRPGEIWRLLYRGFGWGSEDLPDRANQWLMRTMARECCRSEVTAIHAYEGCSLWQFEEAKRLGKRCIYDLPTCYYGTWKNIETELAQAYEEWLPRNGIQSEDHHFERKRNEIQLADLTLVASRFAERTVREFYPHKEIAVIPYGVDLDFWHPNPESKRTGPLRFLYAGNISVRKGIPLLIKAWSIAALRDAELELVGPWFLADDKKRFLPPGVRWTPHCSSRSLRDHYQYSDVFVFPTYADGFGLVLLEAMGCGLAIIASEASGAPEIVTDRCGQVFPTGNLDCLVETIRWVDRNRDKILDMGRAGRAEAGRWSWKNYRARLAEAAATLL